MPDSGAGDGVNDARRVKFGVSQRTATTKTNPRQFGVVAQERVASCQTQQVVADSSRNSDKNLRASISPETPPITVSSP
eukprot:SAG31_NODE_1721_length_7453_cov_35.338727_5_plen_79_part_00